MPSHERPIYTFLLLFRHPSFWRRKPPSSSHYQFFLCFPLFNMWETTTRLLFEKRNKFQNAPFKKASSAPAAAADVFGWNNRYNCYGYIRRAACVYPASAPLCCAAKDPPFPFSPSFFFTNHSAVNSKTGWRTHVMTISPLNRWLCPCYNLTIVS